MWRPAPDLRTSAEAWLTAGGPHHTVLSTALTAEDLDDLAEMTGTELVLIDADTTVRELAQRAALEPGVLPAGAGVLMTGSEPARGRGTDPARHEGENGEVRCASYSPSIAAGSLALALAACGGDDDSAAARAAATPGTIGVAMPTKSSERWIADGNNIKEQLEDAGYEVDLQYAEDDIPTQVSQVENMVTKGVDVLVIAAIDGTALGEVLETAESQDIPVIAYDRLIRDSETVDYYTTFDNFKVGVQQAESLVEGLEASGEGPYNVELFAGSPDDNNATFFCNGAMSVLAADDRLRRASWCPRARPTSSRPRSCAGTRPRRRSAWRTSSPAPTPTETVAGRALAVRRPVARHHRRPQGQRLRQRRKDLPVVTGQDAEVQSVKSIMAGEQYSTIFKDTRELAKVTVDMIKAVARARSPRSTTPRPTTTASRSCRRTCSTRCR